MTDLASAHSHWWSQQLIAPPGHALGTQPAVSRHGQDCSPAVLAITLLTIGLLVSDNNSVSIVGSFGEALSIVVSIGCALLVTSVNLVLAAQAHGNFPTIYSAKYCRELSCVAMTSSLCCRVVFCDTIVSIVIFSGGLAFLWLYPLGGGAALVPQM